MPAPDLEHQMSISIDQISSEISFENQDVFDMNKQTNRASYIQDIPLDDDDDDEPVRPITRGHAGEFSGVQRDDTFMLSRQDPPEGNILHSETDNEMTEESDDGHAIDESRQEEAKHKSFSAAKPKNGQKEPRFSEKSGFGKDSGLQQFTKGRAASSSSSSGDEEGVQHPEKHAGKMTSSSEDDHLDFEASQEELNAQAINLNGEDVLVPATDELENESMLGTGALRSGAQDDGMKKEDDDYSVKETRLATGTTPEHPYTFFSVLQQNVIFAVIIFIGFLGPMSGNIYIPALPILEREFNVSTTVINATVSVFMAVFSVGPLIWALNADFGGRKLLYLISMGMNVVVNVLLASLPINIAALFILRILQAFASSSVISLGAGTVSDITAPKNRGKAIAYFMLGPNAGPILAPIIAGLILMNNDKWRWLFGFTSIMAGIGFLAVCIFLPETLRCIVGNGDVRWRYEKSSTGSYESDVKQPRLLLCKNFGVQKPITNSQEFQQLYPRPPKPSLKNYWEIARVPNLTICSLSTALLFATYYGFSVTFSHYLKRDYGYSNLAIGACYACPGVALMLGSIIGGHSSDYYRRKWVSQFPGKKFPSYKRLISQTLGLNISMAGCIGYGWSIHYHQHIALVLFFSFLMAFGMTWCSNSTMTYLTECNPKRAAGTIAVSNSFRNVAAAISSAIIFKLCDAMGVGWCFTGLGLCDLLSMVSVYYLIRNGERFSNISN